MPDGTLVEPGTAGTLKYNGLKIGATAGTTAQNGAFKSMAADGVSIPKLLIAMGLFPEESATYGNDYFYVDPTGERLPFRGSAFDYTSHSGASALGLDYPRSFSHDGVGFRSAFYE